MSKRSRVSIDIRAEHAQVFEALTDESALEQWLAEHARVDRQGGQFDVWGKHTYGNPGPGESRGRILSCDSATGLSVDWTIKGVRGVVTLSLTPSEGGTHLTFAHDFEPVDGETVSLDGFWCLAVQNLRSWVETGKVSWRPDYSNALTGEMRLSVVAQANAATVFEALIDPTQLSRWMMASSPTVTLEVGGTYDLGWSETDGHPLKILDILEDSRLSYSWDDRSSPGTIVTWELEGSEGATRITLVHSGFDRSVPLDDYYGGWGDFLLRLVGICEQGPSWVGPAWSAESYFEAGR